MFSDVSKFNLFSSDRIQWIRPKNKMFDNKYTKGIIKHGGIMVWDPFSGFEMGLLVKINGIMDRS